MPDLTIRDVPQNIVDKLKARAKRNHRTLRGELMDIVERAAAQEPTLTIDELYERMKALGRSAQSDSTEIVRQMRDERYGG